MPSPEQAKRDASVRKELLREAVRGNPWLWVMVCVIQV